MIITEINNNIAWLKLNRPKVKNALSIKLLEQLLKLLKEMDSDNSVRVIVIYGENDFSAGGDINDMLVENKKEADAIAKQVQDIYLNISQISKPIIAYTKGLVFGGGLELALVCDIIISHSNSNFALPEAKLGIIPGGGATQRLKKSIGKQNAAYMLFTGEQFSAQWMLSLNLIQEITDNLERIKNIAQTIAENSPEAIQELKKLLNTDLDFTAESKSFAQLINGNGKKGIQYFIENKQWPKW